MLERGEEDRCGINLLCFLYHKVHQVLEEENRKKIFEVKSVVKHLIIPFKAEIL